MNRTYTPPLPIIMRIRAELRSEWRTFCRLLREVPNWWWLCAGILIPIVVTGTIIIRSWSNAA